MPQLREFVALCRDLMSPQTQFLLALEPRSEEVVAELMILLRGTFSFVKQVDSEAWTSIVDCSHVELFSIHLDRQ
jgi:hypothetical protein